jgi:hypothetical protein
MDRSLMEGNPHSVLEGMIIGAFAIGSHEGYVYIRHEYPMAVENVMTAIKQAESKGLLGTNILGSGFSFKVKVSRGGGAFVCAGKQSGGVHPRRKRAGIQEGQEAQPVVGTVVREPREIGRQFLARSSPGNWKSRRSDGQRNQERKAKE